MTELKTLPDVLRAVADSYDKIGPIVQIWIPGVWKKFWFQEDPIDFNQYKYRLKPEKKYVPWTPEVGLKHIELLVKHKNDELTFLHLGFAGKNGMLVRCTGKDYVSKSGKIYIEGQSFEISYTELMDFETAGQICGTEVENG